MRTLVPVALAVALAACKPLSADSSPTAGVKAAVELYFAGHATGDGAYFRRAFHPEAKLYWIEDGALASKTSAEFAAGALGTPAPDEAQRKRSIALVDVAGDVAIAKVELDYPEVRFVDYLSLIRIDGRWVVINKIFQREAKVPSAK
jgi:hypothetical protein